jgi:hypothetical protein
VAETSRSEKIARAVASDLGKAQLSMSFAAKYDPMPEFELSDLSTLRLTVRDIGQQSLGRSTRGSTNYEYAIQIATLIHIDTSLSQVMSRLKRLAEEIADYFMEVSPTGCDETIDRVEVAEFGTDENLQQRGMGRFVMSLVFFGEREYPDR